MGLPFLSDAMARFVQLVSKLPGLGPRSARRAALFLVKNRETLLVPLLNSLSQILERLRPCPICGYFDERSPCFFCASDREDALLCVVADTADVWAIERGGFFRGRYHVLGGLLSVVEGRTPETIGIDRLLCRLDASVREVILAMNGDVDGQSTAYCVAEHVMAHAPYIKISGLARGIPIGGELDYLDPGTLMSSFLERRTIDVESPTPLRRVISDAL